MQLDFRTHMQDDTDWSNEALLVFLTLESGTTITADELRELAGNPPTPNAMGAVFRSAHKQGLIRTIAYLPSTQPSRHGGMVRLWERC